MSRNTDFEKSLAELEKIVETLESGEATLEESMKLFERGVKLSDDCRKTLYEAKQKIMTLTDAEEENEQDV